ncbi:unnamed protein product, partial [Effrenium voratum]
SGFACPSNTKSCKMGPRPTNEWPTLGIELGWNRRSRGLLHLISLLPLMRRPPQCILLENVVGFERSVCRQRLLAALPDFEVAEFALDPEDFGLPNRRPRYYGLFRSPSQRPETEPLGCA